MASSSIAQSRARSGEVDLLYDCNAPAILKTSRTENNPGKPFYGCGNYSKTSKGRTGCGFFEWANDGTRTSENVDELKEKLTKAEMKLHKTNEKKMTLKREVKRLESELVKKEIKIALLKSKVRSNWNSRLSLVLIVVLILVYDILSSNGTVRLMLPKKN